MKHKKLLKILGISIVITFFVAVMDIFSAKYFWTSMGSLAAQSYQLAESSYMTFFYLFALVVIICSALAYYLAKKDKSEAFAIMTTSGLFIASGLSDIMYYLLQGGLIPSTMPHLYNGFAGITAHMFGLVTVTPIALILNTLIFSVIAILIAKFLVEEL